MRNQGTFLLCVDSQDQRLALARGDGHGSRAMDSATLGSAVSHHPRPFRTLRRRPRASPQEADGLGAPSHTSGSPMGAKPQNRRRRRLQLLGARSDRRGSPPCLSRHEAAPRRQSVRAGAGAPPRTARTPAQKRSAIAQTHPNAREQSDALEQTVDALLVWRSALHSRNHDWNGGLVSFRTALSRWPVLLVNGATRLWAAHSEINGLQSSRVALDTSRIRYSWPT